MYVCVYVYAYFFPQNNFPDIPKVCCYLLAAMKKQISINIYLFD